MEGLETRNVLSTLFVTNASDTGGSGSLRGEIAAAASGDTIRFANSRAGQTIFPTQGELPLSKNLTIQGLGAANLTVSGSTLSPSRVFEIAAGVQDTISDLTIANGMAPVVNNASMAGGGIFNGAGAKLEVEDSSLSGNTASITVSTSNGGVSEIQGAATVAGDGTDNAGGGTVKVENSSLSSNAASITVSGGTYVANASVAGGGIDNVGGTVEVAAPCRATPPPS